MDWQKNFLSTFQIHESQVKKLQLIMYKWSHFKKGKKKLKSLVFYKHLKKIFNKTYAD